MCQRVAGHALLQVQPVGDGRARRPHQQNRVPRQIAQLALKVRAGGRAGGHRQLIVGHPQRHDVEAAGLGHRDELERVTLEAEVHQVDLDQTRHPCQGTLQLVVGDQGAHDQLGRAGAEQVRVFVGQALRRDPVDQPQLHQGLPQPDDGLSTLQVQGCLQLRQASDRGIHRIRHDRHTGGKGGRQCHPASLRRDLAWYFQHIQP